MALLNEMMIYAATYLVIIVGGLLLFNWMSNGFLLAFIKTKMARGKKVLVIMVGKLDNYPSKGWVEGNRFYYYDRETKKKERNKIAKFIEFEKDHASPIKPFFGVQVCMINEVTGEFIIPETGELRGQFDPIQEEQFIIRALQRPVDERMKLLLIIMVIVGFLVLVVGVLSYMNFQTSKANAADLALIKQYMTIQLNQTMQTVGGVVSG